MDPYANKATADAKAGVKASHLRNVKGQIGSPDCEGHLGEGLHVPTLKPAEDEVVEYAHAQPNGYASKGRPKNFEDDAGDLLPESHGDVFCDYIVEDLKGDETIFSGMDFTSREE